MVPMESRATKKAGCEKSGSGSGGWGGDGKSLGGVGVGNPVVVLAMAAMVARLAMAENLVVGW